MDFLYKGLNFYTKKLGILRIKPTDSAVKTLNKKDTKMFDIVPKIIVSILLAGIIAIVWIVKDSRSIIFPSIILCFAFYIIFLFRKL